MILPVTADDLIVALATLEFADDDLLAFAVSRDGRGDNRAGHIRLADNGIRAVCGEQKHFFERHRVPHLGVLEVRNTQFEALFGLFLEACDVDDCEHDCIKCRESVAGWEKGCNRFYRFAKRNDSHVSQAGVKESPFAIAAH